MGMEDEIKAMNNSFQGISTDEPTTEAVATESPATEAASTEAPSTESPSTEMPSTEGPTTEAPAVDERDALIEELRAKLAEKESSKKEDKAPATAAPLTFEDQDFIGDLDLDELSADPKALNKLFNKVYQKAVIDTQKTLSQNFTSTIPAMVKENVSIITTLREASEQFYKDNSDLSQFKKVVATVFEELATKDPSRNYADIMKDVAPEARKRLGLKPPAASTKKKEESSPPRLPKKSGKSTKQSATKPTKSPIESEIEAMNKVLGR